MSDLYCSGKRAYDKKGAITAKNLRYREDHVKLRMYPCPQGDHWHLTKQLVQRSRAIRIFNKKKSTR